MNQSQITLSNGETAVIELDILASTLQGDVTWSCTGDVQLNIYEMPGVKTVAVLRTGDGNGTVTATANVLVGEEVEVAVHEFVVTTDGSPLIRANVTHLPAANDPG